MLKKNILLNINWKKINGLVPCIIQNIYSGEVLMHAYMNKESLKKTQLSKQVTFYSRTKQRIWKKGESSGNYLNVLDMILDCDKDSLLILVDPIGVTCHLKNYSCFNGQKTNYTNFFYLENIIKNKKIPGVLNSYTAALHNSGINRISQKVGEEAVEVVISAISNNTSELINESCDLIYHLLVLLHFYDLDFSVVINNLINRNNCNKLN